MQMDMEHTLRNGAAGRLRKALVAAASVAVVTVAGTGIALADDPTPGAQPPPPGCMHRHHEGQRMKMRRGGHMGRMAAALNLTDAQQQQIRGIFQKSRADGQAIRGKMGELRKQMHDLITSGKYSDDAARAIAQKYQSAFVDASVHMAHTMSQVHAVLTPEQQAKAKEMGSKMGGHRGMMGPGGFMDGPEDGPPAPPSN